MNKNLTLEVHAPACACEERRKEPPYEVHTKTWIAGITTTALTLACWLQRRKRPHRLELYPPEPAGANCQYGGIKIQGGSDTNSNGKLDASEIDSSMTQYACAVLAQGKTALVSIVDLAADANAQNGVNGCTNGGYEIKSGLDANNNGTLDDNEVESHVFLCNGLNGTNGTNGVNGTNGTNGAEAARTPSSV